MSRSHSLAAFALSALLGLCVATPAQAGTRTPQRAPLELNAFGPTRPLTDTAWLVARVGQNRRFELRADGSLSLLERYLEPQRNRTPEWQSFWHGRFGRNNFQLHPKLVWFSGAAGEESAVSAPLCEELPALSELVAGWSIEDQLVNELTEATERSWRFELRGPELAQPFDFSRADVLPDWSLGVQSPEPEFFGVRQQKACPRWQMPRPVSVVRYDGEWTRMALVDCQGAIAPDALDRLSVLARPPATAKPEFPLPIEPDEDAPSGEWLPRVKLLNPRLIWAVQQIAEAFPQRSIFIMSGYRRDAHGSYHQKGQALDLYVAGIDNADLFRFCHTLNDVGCGYYPNNKFVHVDVRPFGSHRVAWVDISGPGEPSEYVSSWPGIIGPQELSTASGE